MILSSKKSDLNFANYKNFHLQNGYELQEPHKSRVYSFLSQVDEAIGLDKFAGLYSFISGQNFQYKQPSNARSGIINFTPNTEDLYLAAVRSNIASGGANITGYGGNPGDDGMKKYYSYEDATANIRSHLKSPLTFGCIARPYHNTAGAVPMFIGEAADGQKRSLIVSMYSYTGLTNVQKKMNIETYGWPYLACGYNNDYMNSGDCNIPIPADPANFGPQGTYAPIDMTGYNYIFGSFHTGTTGYVYGLFNGTYSTGYNVAGAGYMIDSSLSFGGSSYGYSAAYHDIAFGFWCNNYQMTSDNMRKLYNIYKSTLGQDLRLLY